MLVVAAIMLIGLLAVTAQAQTADVTAPVVSNVIPANGATVYTNGTSTITSVSADYSDEVGGSGIDPTSIMVHLDGGNMLFDCPTQTASHVACNATVADLPPGPHTLDVYVMDMAGNLTMNHTTFTVVVDNQPPFYSNLTPVDGSTILTSTLGSLVFAVDYGDPVPSSGGLMPMIHVNDSHDGTSGAMIMGCTKTATHYSCSAVKAKRLHLGSNWMEVLIADKVGNNNYSLPSRMNWYTVVDDVAPGVSAVGADATSITASYADPEPAGRMAGSASLASGISLASVAVYFDGAALSGCTAAAGSVSCPTPAAAPGPHAIQVLVSDNAGNTGSGAGSYVVACTGGRPALGLRVTSASWASMMDYNMRRLSVRYAITNAGPDAYGVQITGATATAGVMLDTPVPQGVGDIAAGSSASVVLAYHVPANVGRFYTSVSASAQDVCGATYTYPV